MLTLHYALPQCGWAGGGGGWGTWEAPGSNLVNLPSSPCDGNKDADEALLRFVADSALHNTEQMLDKEGGWEWPWGFQIQD